MKSFIGLVVNSRRAKHLFIWMQPGYVLTSEDVPEFPDKKRQAFYSSMVALLQFGATWVRFDISYTIGHLARFCALAGASHTAALHHPMEYLHKHPSFKLDYHKGPTNVTGLDGYCNADWGTSDSRRTITDNIFRYNGAPIQWKSKLQKSVATSTAEAGYHSASLGAAEVIYLRQLLRDMGFEPTSPTPVCEDNPACIEWTNIFWPTRAIRVRERWRALAAGTEARNSFGLFRVPRYRV